MTKPNGYFLRGAVPGLEKSREEYIGTVYGSSALAYMTIMHTLDSLDALKERCPKLVRHTVRRAANAIMGKDGDSGECGRLRGAINHMLVNDADRAWMADFGNAAYERIEPDVMALQNAVANALGRYPVEDINVFASVIVSQSLASNAAAYTKRRSELFRGHTVEDRLGEGRQPVARLLDSLSCAALDRHLRAIAVALLEPALPHGTDLLADRSVMTGVKAVLNAMASVGTWEYAREKADRLNGKQAKDTTV